MIAASEREKRLALLAFAAFALLLLDRVWLRPLLRGWSAMSEKLMATQTELERARGLLARREMIKSRWKQFQSEIARAAKEGPASFLSYLSSLEKRAGMKEQHRKPIRVETRNGFQVGGYDLHLTGGLPELVKFLYELDYSDRFLRVDKLAITSADRLGTKLSVDMRISTLVFESRGRPNVTKSEQERKS